MNSLSAMHPRRATSPRMMSRDAHQLNECSSLNESGSNLIRVLASGHRVESRSLLTSVVSTNPFWWRPTMYVRIGTKILNALFVLLLNASLGSVLNAQTVDDRPLSPRLQALQERLKSGGREALDNFWKEISERGAPIVEEVPGNDRDMLVTMVWRAKEETKK